MFETTDQWLHPLGIFKDEDRPGLCIVSAAMHAEGCEVERGRTSSVPELGPAARRRVPKTVRAELDAFSD